MCFAGVPDCTDSLTLEFNALDTSIESAHEIARLNDIILINDYCLTEVWEKEERRAKNFLLEKEIEKLQAKILIYDFIKILDNYIHSTFVIEKSSRGAHLRFCGLTVGEFLEEFGVLIEYHVEEIEGYFDFVVVEKETGNLVGISAGMKILVEAFDEEVSPCAYCRAIFARLILTTVGKNIRRKYLKPAQKRFVSAKNTLEKIQRKISDAKSIIESSRDRLNEINARLFAQQNAFRTVNT